MFEIFKHFFFLHPDPHYTFNITIKYKISLSIKKELAQNKYSNHGVWSLQKKEEEEGKETFFFILLSSFCVLTCFYSFNFFTLDRFIVSRTTDNDNRYHQHHLITSWQVETKLKLSFLDSITSVIISRYIWKQKRKTQNKRLKLFRLLSKNQQRKI